jgi:hypothetical protein
MLVVRLLGASELQHWVLPVLATAYLGVMAPNLPLRVLLATALFLGIFLTPLFLLPPMPSWIIAVLVVAIGVCYKLQAWSHRIFNVEYDMTEFNRKYPKGSTLFVVLLFYEVPIVLNYLVFEGKGAAPQTQNGNGVSN